MTEQDLFEMIRFRYQEPEYVVLRHVRMNDYDVGTERFMDAIAINLWRSRGFQIHGFEIKCDRGDWVKELKNPAKAEAALAHCDYWWLVISDQAIVQEGELPPTWGLLTPRGKFLVAKVKAPALQPKPIGRQFLSDIVRRVIEQRHPDIEIQDAFRRGKLEGRKEGEQDALEDHKFAVEEAKRIQEAVAEFERASGVRIETWNAGNVGVAVRRLLQNDQDWLRDVNTLRRVAAKILEEVEASGLLKSAQDSSGT